MRPALTLVALAASILIAFAAFACGSDDGGTPTLGAYLERMAEIGQDFNAAGEELQTEFDDQQAEASTEQERIDVLVEFIDATIGVFQTFAEDAGDIEPPEPAASAHETAVTSARGVIAALQDAQDDLEDVTSESDAVEVVGQILGSAVIVDFEQSCFDLQALADEENVDVDLGCGS